jgi:hypothetical protein
MFLCLKYPRIVDGKFLVPTGESRLHKNKSGSYYSFDTAEGELVNYTPEQWGSTLETIFSRAAYLVPRDSDHDVIAKSLNDSTAYSIRKSARKWAAASGASDNDCANTGRWAAGSKNQDTYLQGAGFDGDMESEYNSYKPMTKVMTFKRTQTMELNPASALGNHISFRGY